jgi:MFS family permease
LIKTTVKQFKGNINYFCILFEGIFNLMGYDLLGIASIVPLFLSEYGASLGFIGMLTTIQGISTALVPLLFGGFAAKARSKKRFSILLNGCSRGLVLLVPAALLCNLSNGAIIGVFMFVFVLLFMAAPLTGLTWNYLLNDCIGMRERPKLLGVLFAMSGVVSFGTSNLIKVIRDSSSLPSNMKYFYIFGFAAVAMCISVLCFVPLRENHTQDTQPQAFKVKEYLSSLATCFHNRDFNKLVRANVFSYISVVLNSFIYIYAERTLKLESNLISNMIIFQTVGLIAGGIVTGQVSARFGVKRMLVLVECAGLFIPLVALLCGTLTNPYPLMCLCVALFGFIRSGQLGYTNYIIEVVEKEKLIFHMVAKGLLLLPLSFLSTFAGLYIQSHWMAPIFIVQAAASLAAILMCTKLRLVSREQIKISI